MKTKVIYYSLLLIGLLNVNVLFAAKNDDITSEDLGIHRGRLPFEEDAIMQPLFLPKLNKFSQEEIKYFNDNPNLLMVLDVFYDAYARKMPEADKNKTITFFLEEKNDKGQYGKIFSAVAKMFPDQSFRFIKYSSSSSSLGQQNKYIPFIMISYEENISSLSIFCRITEEEVKDAERCSFHNERPTGNWGYSFIEKNNIFYLESIGRFRK